MTTKFLRGLKSSAKKNSVLEGGEENFDSRALNKNNYNQNNNLPSKGEDDITNTPEHEEFNINPNSIFDYNLFMDSFPSLLGVIPTDNDESDYFTKLRRLFNAQDYHQILNTPEFAKFSKNKINVLNNPDLKYDPTANVFGYEPTWGGVIESDGLKYWQNIVERVGEIKLGKFNFINSLYAETPIIFTQKSLPFDVLKSQVKKMYEIAFEEYKTPYILICSQAMLNLYSHNLSSGMVVDMGESGLEISSIKDGFTQYDKTIYSSFMSGRNITSMLAVYLKSKKIEISEYGDADLFNISLSDYLEAKFLKETNPAFHCFNNQIVHNNPDTDTDYKNLKINFRDISTLNYLYTFPEVYKYLFNTNLYPKDYLNDNNLNTFISQLKNVSNFIVESKDNKNFHERDKMGKMNYYDFDKNYINPIFNQLFNSVEKRVLLRPTTYINKEELIRFRKLSLSHLLLSQLEENISEDLMSANKYVNIAYAGGVLNTTYLPTVLTNDFNNLIKNEQEGINLQFIKNVNDGMAFFKGANFLSKIDNLESIMISKQEYFDYGADNLCYNYI